MLCTQCLRAALHLHRQRTQQRSEACKVLLEYHDLVVVLLTFAYLRSLLCFVSSQAETAANAADIAAARFRYDSAKICDNPECLVCESSGNRNTDAQICPRCRTVATVLLPRALHVHWPQRISLCNELIRRICDYTECRRSVEALKCSRCLQARYCCNEHGALDWRRHRTQCEKKSSVLQIDRDR
jgi:hypothetical protein